EAGDDAKLDRIAPDRKHDRDCCSRCSGSKDAGVPTGRGQHRNLTANQIGRQALQAIVLTLARPDFDRNVLALDEAGFPQSTPEGRHHVRRRGGRATLQHPDYRLSPLLPPRRERPRRRPADQRDELASLHHSITSSATNRMSRLIVSPTSLAAFTLMTSSNLV